ncbi:MAG: UvrB/UvrC motif-containing protein [Bacillota bacterium]
MLCDNCKANEASVHTMLLAGGVKRVLHLCEDCAKKRGLPLNKLPMLIQLISGAKEDDARLDQEKKCPRCGCSLKDFREQGILGCSECYNALREELAGCIKRAHNGRTDHVGRRPSAAEKDDLLELTKQLKEAIAAEEYERAASLRDKIKELREHREEGK